MLLGLNRGGLGALVFAATAAGGCMVTPQPLTDSHLSNLASENLARVTADQEPVRGPIDLYEAMARALKYNLDYRVELFEKSLRATELDLSHYSLLPKIIGGAGFDRRNNFNASSSFNLVTNTPNFGASTSRDRQLRERDLEISWDILDFGLSYVRARQTADKVLIAEETKRKILNRIIEDVRTAYWRAVSAERLAARLRLLEGRTKRALANARSLSSDKQTSPITALTYERELVAIKRTIQELTRDLSVAKSQLAALMNLEPDSKFRLRLPHRYRRGLRLHASAREMVWAALQNRPELREVAYRQRINMREADAAILELLPNFRLFASTNFDSNSFLLNNHWFGWGAKATWHLLKVAEYPAKRAVLKAQDRLLHQRSLALTMAVMTQVHVSRIRFFHYARELGTAREYYDVQRRLVEKMRAEASGGRISEQTLLREEMNTLVAEVKKDVIYSGLQNAYANVHASMGLDPYSHQFDLDLNVKELAKTLRSVWVVRGDSAHR
ncbi:MAG: TolC family protein [Hyphomicrobiaceae bacterium]